MPEATSNQESPTYFANLVTLTVNVDETVLEFRRVMRPHKDFELKRDGSLSRIPPATPEEIKALEPIARVVLTYTAAQALKENLTNMLAPVDRARRSGEKDPWKTAN